MISGLICTKDANKSEKTKQDIPILDIQDDFDKFLEIFNID